MAFTYSVEAVVHAKKTVPLTKLVRAHMFTKGGYKTYRLLEECLWPAGSRPLDF